MEPPSAAMLSCRQEDLAQLDWDLLDRLEDRTIFQTRQWLEFIAETQDAQPVVFALIDRDRLAGYFTGLTFRRWGVKILGSSFPGWTTPYMGFNLLPGTSRSDALGAIEKVALDGLGCLHIEISDPLLQPEEARKLGFECRPYHTRLTDLSRPEEAVFRSMESACRRCIRRAEKSGVTIEEAHDREFADEYYEQLKDVYAKQGLVPSYGLSRVQSLIRHLHPTGRLLLVRARNREGRCIATGIFPGLARMAVFWGNASWRWGQSLRPNEAIHWYAMRYWKRRGTAIYEWGGETPYKKKYGGTPFQFPQLMKSRYRILPKLRRGARKAFNTRQRFLGWVHGWRGAP